VNSAPSGWFRRQGVALLALSITALLTSQQTRGQISSTQLRVTTVPAGATVICDSKTHAISPTTIDGLPAGEHLVIANLPGHREIRQTVVLQAGERAAVHLRLEPLRGLLLVHSDPAGADVELDGANRGKTPLLLTDVEFGAHRLTFALQGFQSMEKDLRVDSRAPQKLTADLLSNSGSLDVSSEPAGARIRLNGIEMGATPKALKAIPPGDNEIELQLTGYALYKQAFKIDAGQVLPMSVELTPLPASLTIVSTPEKAKIYIDDQLRGEAPITIQGIEPGTYRIRAKLRGYAESERDVDVAQSQMETEEFILQRNSGILEVVTEPTGVRVYVDGVDYGETENVESDLVSKPLRVDLLEVGPHILQLTRNGYFATKMDVEIERDETLTRHLKLKRRFIPDIEIQTRGLGKTVYRGVLTQRMPNGDVRIEEYENIFVTIKKENIVRSRPIKDQAE